MPQLGQEHIPPNETAAIQAVTDISDRILKRQPPVKRGEHPKGHGCVRGRFQVLEDVPEALQVGLFGQLGRSWPACIRYSNFSVKHDAQGDAHGMAIKLFGVPGEKVLEHEKEAQTHDFLVVDHPVFPVRNAQDYVAFFGEIERTKSRNPVRFFITGWNPLRWRWTELWIALAIRLRTITSPLETPYWSMVPYALGDQAVKYAAIPHRHNWEGGFWRRLGFRSRDYLRDALRDHLSSRPASFDFYVQVQTDPVKMPVEDPTVRWRSPLVKVAVITIPPQTFESPAQTEFCENLSYTPWHALPAHRPLGGINRTRKQVYDTIANIRHDLNQVTYQEPTVEEFEAVFPEQGDGVGEW
ncbi:catalase family protein [Nodosilinea sp. P-1105]|uniref:catalase family protein n=1 Tax=Nodosilinea sp. P-1105 TaxID=2546229 RepID=UPI00146DAADF|nr:catalase family protein [Nodosilinea sp. P-1105]NMF85498.1 catalase [Nodosilinea sp. P-1105]